jgi:uncharacterized membrane protein YvbJ
MAKFCTNCGKKMDTDATFCVECGSHNTGEYKKNTPEDFKDNFEGRYGHTNFLAFIGLFLSLGGQSFPGLVLSIIGLVYALKHNGDGKKVAISGIVISCVTFLLYVGIFVFRFFIANRK